MAAAEHHLSCTEGFYEVTAADQNLMVSVVGWPEVGILSASSGLPQERTGSCYGTLRLRRQSCASCHPGCLVFASHWCLCSACCNSRRGDAPAWQLLNASIASALSAGCVYAGCFWGLELAFQRVPGVTHTSVGYTAGQDTQPDYRKVCTGRTGHAEAVQVCASPPATLSPCQLGAPSV